MFYQANDKYNAVLSSGYTAGQATLNVSETPTNVPTIVVVAKGTVKEVIFTVTGKTTGAITGLTRLRGYAGNLDNNMPVTCLNNSEFINQYANAVSTPESLKQILYGVDGGSTDAYAIALDVAPGEYVEGLMVVFKANTVNTGAATLNVNSLGAKALVKNVDKPLANGDIQAGAVVVAVYDGASFQIQGVANVAVESNAANSGAIDFSKARTTVLTLTGNTANTTLTQSGGVVGKYYSVEIVNNGNGANTVTWFAGITWIGGTTPQIKAGAGVKSTYVFRCTATDTYDGYIC